MGIDFITIIIIAATVVMSLKGFKDYSFFEKNKFNIGRIRRGEQSRMIASGFLHVDQRHLFFNMITLYFFSGIVISRLGQVKFAIIYFGSLLAGNLLSYSFHKGNANYTAVGASGAVTGVIYSAILFDPWMKINYVIPGFLFGIGYLFYSIYGMKANNDNIGHDAHFGGAIGGYVLTLIMAPFLLDEILMVGVLAIPIVVLFIMKRAGQI
ncbi:MAG: rhomboid family intramembrane serine protease [Flavobacteriaceae bacterium]|nr:rhomboid family intramembrane serine protease [Flavobacteriaceae bacterium]